MKPTKIPNDPIENRTRDMFKQIIVKTPDFCFTYNLKRYCIFCFTFPTTKQRQQTKASEVLPTYPGVLSVCTLGVAVTVMCKFRTLHGQGLMLRITSYAPDSFILTVMRKYYDKRLQYIIRIIVMNYLNNLN